MLKQVTFKVEVISQHEFKTVKNLQETELCAESLECKEIHNSLKKEGNLNRIKQLFSDQAQEDLNLGECRTLLLVEQVAGLENPEPASLKPLVRKLLEQSANLSNSRNEANVCELLSVII